MLILMILLFVEYRFFHKQAREMIELKQQYVEYVDLLNRKINGDSNALEDEREVTENDVEDEMIEESPLEMQAILAAEASDAPDDDDDYADDSFVVINRQPDYLKQSTLDYIEAQEMNSLMTAIDIDRWS